MLRPFRFIINEYVRAYSGLPRRAWILFIVNLINSSGSMVFFFLSLYLTRKIGLSAARAGQALSLYGFGSLAGAYVGGWLADRIGSILVQKISLAACGVLLIALGQAKTMAGIAPLLFAMALAAGTLFPANATSMSRICPPGLQVKGFALNRLANNLGATIGPAVGGILALSNYGLLFWADGLTSLAAAAVFALLWPGARVEGERKPAKAAEGDALEASAKSIETAKAPKSLSPWRDFPFLLMMVIFFVWSVVFIQVLTTLPIYMRNVYGLAENRIGLLYPINTIMIVVFEMILMEKIRKYPLARTINISFVLLGIGLGMMPFGRGYAFGALTVAVWTFGEMLSMPLVTALISERADDSNRGRYMGLNSLSFSLAFIVGPAVGTAIYDGLGPDAVWYVCAATCAVITVAFSALRPALAKR
ncbi:MAG TPA: MFS transporter [Acidobacteriota bacterium]|nr:MFS transporter [Acidobacteriota bacterium]